MTSSTFMPIVECRTKDCRKTKLTLQNRGSKFEKFQELKIQELTEQVCEEEDIASEASCYNMCHEADRIDIGAYRTYSTVDESMDTRGANETVLSWGYPSNKPYEWQTLAEQD